MPKHKKAKHKKTAEPVTVEPSGMRRDATRKAGNVALASEDSLIEEMQWRREHKQ